jgi:suppressor of fused protein SUFU
MQDEVAMGFWERTWQERHDEIHRAFGDTFPPKTVVSFSWKDRIRCPGGCALHLPPIEASRDPLRHRRDDWLYLTMGLSQPLDEKQVETERAAGKSYSSFGFEFAFVTPNECTWATQALYYFITYLTDGERIKWGDRFPFGFHRRATGELAVYTGDGESAGLTPIGEMRAVLFWPYLFPDSTLVTSTGKFMVMVATGITSREWELAKQTTTAHVLLLLCRAGIVQRTIPERQCLLASAKWRSEWSQIEKMSPDECMAEIDAGIGRWHLSKPVEADQ